MQLLAVLLLSRCAAGEPLVVCYGEGSGDCAGGLPAGGSYVGMRLADAPAAVAAFRSLPTPVHFQYKLSNEGFYYSGGGFDWLSFNGGCGQGNADHDDLVLSPEYAGGVNGCSSDSWLPCLPQLETVRTRLDALVPGATFSWIGRSRHHQWLVLDNCAARIGQLNAAIGLAPSSPSPPPSPQPPPSPPSPLLPALVVCYGEGSGDCAGGLPAGGSYVGMRL